MALDQTLLEAACEEDFVPTLRFYRWSPPALSIGRFQPIDDVDLDSCAAEGIEVTRRPTGGKSILHLDDFTYSIVMPRGFPLPDGVVEAYRLISEGILLALERLGLDAVIRPGGGRTTAGPGAPVSPRAPRLTWSAAAASSAAAPRCAAGAPCSSMDRYYSKTNPACFSGCCASPARKSGTGTSTHTGGAACLSTRPHASTDGSM